MGMAEPPLWGAIQNIHHMSRWQTTPSNMGPAWVTLKITEHKTSRSYLRISDLSRTRHERQHLLFSNCLSGSARSLQRTAAEILPLALALSQPRAECQRVGRPFLGGLGERKTKARVWTEKTQSESRVNVTLNWKPRAVVQKSLAKLHVFVDESMMRAWPAEILNPLARSQDPELLARVC